MLAAVFLVLAAFAVSSYCKIYTSVSDLPGSQYDFVVVGGGTAGSVVANRLTENPSFSVLVLEAGPTNEGVVDSEAPFLVIDMIGNPIWSWNFSSTPQPGLNGRVIPYARARILGGCSSHNGMYYTRGSRDDFDRFAKVTGDPGWSWDRLLPYFFKNEKWTAPADHHNTQGQFNPLVHGTNGMTSVSLTGFSYPASARVFQTTKELADEFPFNLDMNGGTPLGVGWLQETIGGGERSSAATSYLSPKFQQRPNLHILLNAQVSRLLGNTANGGAVFHGVEFSQDQSGPLSTVRASKEIILSAGVIGTPHILFNSGVGDKTALEALGIPTLLDLPSVGKNVSDHPVLSPTWSVNSTETVESIRQNATRFNEAFGQWNRTKTGPFVAIGVTHVGWSRVDMTSVTFNQFQDPSAGPASPHVELMFTAGSFGGLMPGHFFSIGTAVVSPMSRGSISFNSTNPFDPPLIDPGLLQSDFDVLALREGIKMARKFVTAPVWQGYILAPTADLANVTTDADLDAYVRRTAGSSSHLVGSAAMSARDAGYGVVNPDLLVKGATGLRIIDASVFPFVPSAHTQAATYVFAERGSDLIKKVWS
ncbi:pyranose dehydrogenase [Mycena sp. CBHHK59/15]|nr:pyranose dehydrogenase [Mycena sp. CBHHK59/15]